MSQYLHIGRFPCHGIFLTDFFECKIENSFPFFFFFKPPFKPPEYLLLCNHLVPLIPGFISVLQMVSEIIRALRRFLYKLRSSRLRVSVWHTNFSSPLPMQESPMCYINPVLLWLSVGLGAEGTSDRFKKEKWKSIYCNQMRGNKS